MAKFLNTSGTNFCLEELIKSSTEHLILINPYLRLNDRIKKLLEEKKHLKTDIRIVCDKSDLHPHEIKWLQTLDYIHLSYCKGLHAKCYLNESKCIISSLNLYEFNQINNNEMGILIHKYEDADIFKDAYEEVQRILRISNEVKITFNEMTSEAVAVDIKNIQSISKLTTSKLAAKYNVKTSNLLEKFVEKELLILNGNNKYHLTTLGKSYGGEFKSSQYGGYFIWPENIQI